MCSLKTSWLIIVFNEHLFHLFQWSSDNLSLGRSSFSTAVKVEAISLCQDADLLVSWHNKWQEAHQIVVSSQVAASLSWLSCQSVMMITTCIYIHIHIYIYTYIHIYTYIIWFIYIYIFIYLFIYFLMWYTYIYIHNIIYIYIYLFIYLFIYFYTIW